MAETAFAVPSSGSSFDAMLQPSQEQLDETIAGLRRKSDEAFERAGKAADTIAANRAASDKLEMPEMVPLPEAPTPEMRDPIEAFGSTASVLGILGSMLTRRPLTNALNAAAGTMNAYRANDIQGAKLQFDTWKANMDNVKVLNDWQMERYKTALEKFDKNSRAALSEVQAYASAFKDDPMLDVLRTQDPRNVFRLLQAREAAEIRAVLADIKVEEHTRKKEIEARLIAELGPGATAKQISDIQTRVWNPSAAAALQNAERKEGLTPDQEMDNSRAAYEQLYPLDALRMTRSRANKPEAGWPTWMGGTGTPVEGPIPTPDEFLKNDWPKIREGFMKSRGAATVSPPGGASPPPVTRPGAAAPTSTPAPSASVAPAKVESDFIAVPEKFRNEKDGFRFTDTKGTYGKPGTVWIIRGDKAYPTAAAQPGGQGGPAFNQSSLQIPPDVQRQLEALPNNEARLALLNRLDPRGKFRGFSSAADPADRALTSLGDTSYKPGELDVFIAQNKAFQVPNVPVVGATPTGRSASAVDSAKLLKQQALNAAARGFSPEMLAELDRRFPAKVGDKSFADIARGVRRNNIVSQDQAQQFAQDRGKIEDTHNVTLRNTKLLETAWGAPPKRRAEILKQLEGNWAEATSSQKIEIVKLYVANLMGIGADTAAETAVR